MARVSVTTGRSAPRGGSRLGAPEPIRDEHDRSAFDSGVPSLDDWLRRNAHRAEGLSARTFVVCDGRTIVGYYCLAAGGIAQAELPKPLRRNMPDPIPVIIIGRLATDRRYRGIGIGAGLLNDAILRAVNISTAAGVRGILVHALDDSAAAFYLKYDFMPCPVDPLTMILRLETAVESLA